MTPPYRQKVVQDGSAAYHGYWALGFTASTRTSGPKPTSRAFVDCAHSLGLKVILDVVVNHTADVISGSSRRNDYGPPEDATFVLDAGGAGAVESHSRRG